VKEGKGEGKEGGGKVQGEMHPSTEGIEGPACKHQTVRNTFLFRSMSS